MRHIIYRIAVAISITVAVCSCTSSKDTTSEIPVLDFGKAIENMTDIKLSDFGSKITYIPLETNDSCLIGSAPSSLTVTEHFVIVSNSSRQGNDCLVFDRATGKFLNSVGHAGQDSEAFSSPRPVIDGTTGYLTFLGNTDRMLLYNINGTLENTIQLPTSARNINCYIFDGKNPLIYTGANIESKQRELLLINPEGRMLDSLVALNDSIFYNTSANNIEPDNIASISIVGLPNSFPGTIISFKMKSGNDKVMFQNLQTLWNNDNFIHFREIFTDTIYNYTDNNLKPAYILDMGNKSFTIADIGSKELEKESPILYYFLENSDLLVCYGKIGLFSKENFIGIYDKNISSLSVSHLPAEGLVNDIDGFATVTPVRLTTKNEFAGLMTMEQISYWIEEHPDYQFHEDITWIKDLPEDANPVLVIISD